MTIYRNLTGSPLRILLNDGQVIDLLVETVVPALVGEPDTSGAEGDVQVRREPWRNLRFLPEPRDGHVFVCAEEIAREATRLGRRDVLCADWRTQAVDDKGLYYKRLKGFGPSQGGVVVADQAVS